MFEFTNGKPCPDYGLFGVYRKYSNIYIEQTALCAGNCIFCTAKNRTSKGVMSLPDLEYVLASLPEHEGMTFLCGNGEALLLDDLPERVKLVRQYWPNSLISMTSTLNVERDMAYFTRLFEAGLRHIDLSCHAHCREDYARLHGVDALDTVRRNVEYIAHFQQRYQLMLHLYLMNDTGARFGVAHADAKKMKFIAFAGERQFFTNGIQACEEWLLPERETVISPPFPCSIVWGRLGGELHITWDLCVAPCRRCYNRQFSLGNLRENPVETIFKARPFADLYAAHWLGGPGEPWPCKTCAYPMHTPSESELMRMAAYAGEQLAGKEVWFYLADRETYENTKLFFTHCRLKGTILSNKTGTRLGSVPPDSSPFAEYGQLANQASPAPIVIFAKPHDNMTIMKAILQDCPNYSRGLVTVALAKTYSWHTGMI